MDPNQKYIDTINLLLEAFKVNRRIDGISGCTPSMFVVLYERMFGTLPKINRQPATAEDHIYNLTLVLNSLERRYPKLGIELIDPEKIFKKDVFSIQRLILIFKAVAVLSQQEEPSTKEENVSREIHSNKETHIQTTVNEEIKEDTQNIKDEHHVQETMEKSIQEENKKDEKMKHEKIEDQDDFLSGEINAAQPPSVDEIRDSKGDVLSSISHVFTSESFHKHVLEEALQRAIEEKRKQIKPLSRSYQDRKQREKELLHSSGQEADIETSARSKSSRKSNEMKKSGKTKTPKRASSAPVKRKSYRLSKEEQALKEKIYMKCMHGFIEELNKLARVELKRNRCGFLNFIESMKSDRAFNEKFRQEQERLFQSMKKRREAEQELAVRKIEKHVRDLLKQKAIFEDMRFKQLKRELMEENRLRMIRLNNFYQHKIDLIKEKAAEQKRNREISLKAQRLALDRLYRDVKEEQLRKLYALQDRLNSREEAKWNRSFNFEKLKEEIGKRIDNLTLC